jgi:hypothetical protein
MGTSWPNMERRGPVVTDEDIRAFEQRIGATLPDAYRAFILEVNGGRTTEDHVQFRLRKGETNLNTLYSLNNPSGGDLAYRAKSLSGKLPSELIPIGADDFGSEVCIVVHGERRGEVWFFDKLNERPDDANPRVEWFKRRDMIRLAADFRSFMASLTPLEQ